ncbi:SDR family NAD(P)-dependent oxidoreductase [Spongiibacter sp. KMU-158]|uniref:NADP-dependent 3-hydroxy acid dehydrogenase YdfG n=1 Tax=Spongiibacter pelagi TaxID=2760804 RepID=A0A927BYA6_9GAMM|nr:SDR family NAD(P)-dependent oxidoreductase [Spongiibacter pelagi]MBD2857789.1 SDR family NAD(P)-dependent oxidoreductase [Spongiibacter pelagi]
MRTETALITGASDGIGREYARQLQARCKTLILLGRSETKLAAVEAELQAMAGDELSVHCFALDLAGTIGQTRLMEVIRQKGPVSILINNAGFALQEKVAECDLDGQLNMISLHCDASLIACRAALPFMREAGRGQIINVASLAAFLPMPEVAVYAATKAFLLSLSQSIAIEEKRYGIKVQCLCPGYTRTGFHDRDQLANFDAGVIPEEAWSSVEAVVAQSLAEMDGEGRLAVVPGDANQQVARGGLANLRELI